LLSCVMSSLLHRTRCAASAAAAAAASASKLLLLPPPPTPSSVRGEKGLPARRCRGLLVALFTLRNGAARG